MKSLLFAALVMLSTQTYANGLFPASTQQFIPKNPTMRVMSGSMMMTVGYLAIPSVTYVGLSTMATGWAIAGLEFFQMISGQAWAPQTADEMVELQREMSQGEVSELAEVKQATIKEALLAIEADPKAMSDLNQALPDASHLEKLVVGLQVVLTPVME